MLRSNRAVLKRWWVLVAAMVAVSGIWAEGAPPDDAVAVQVPETQIKVVPIRAPFFPTPPQVIEGWINARTGPEVEKIRHHAWDLWAALTEKSGQVVGGQELPIWETWYSRTEVYDPAGPTALRRDRPRRRGLTVPKQIIHDRPVAAQLATPTNQQTALRVLAGVKYDEIAARHVWSHRYYNPQHLTDINNSFGPTTPIADRKIVAFPRQAVLLKPTYWIIKQSGLNNTLTLLPYWPWPNATAPQSTDYPTWPESITWKTYFALDPSGQKVGQTVTGQILLWNGTNQNQQPTDPYNYSAKVIGLDQFYHFTLTADDIAVINSSSPQVDVIVNTTTGEATPAPGDYAILVGMHVTTKEIDDWTWQTFWWTPDHNANPLSRDQTKEVVGIWKNFAMSPAYYMVEPPASKNPGQDLVGYNPYLELDLAPIGQRSNCMSCHRAATWPGLSYNGHFNGAINPAGPEFANQLKLDFLWSIQGGAMGNQGPAVATPPRPTKSPPGR
jgi:hypothetical protein